MVALILILFVGNIGPIVIFKIIEFNKKRKEKRAKKRSHSKGGSDMGLQKYIQHE